MEERIFDFEFFEPDLGDRKNWHLLKCTHHNDEKHQKYHYRLLLVEDLGWYQYKYKCSHCGAQYLLIEGNQDSEGNGAFFEIKNEE